MRDDRTGASSRAKGCAFAVAAVAALMLCPAGVHAQPGVIAWASLRSASAGTTTDRNWDPSGQQLAIRTSTSGDATVVTVERRTGGLFGMGRSSWTVATAAGTAGDVDIDCALLSDGRVVIRVIQRALTLDDTSGMTQDEIDQIETRQAGASRFRGYYVLAWAGDGPTAASWVSTDQEEVPPAWVQALDPTTAQAITAAPAPAAVPETPSRSDIVAAMTAVRDSVTACGGGQHGVATVSVEVTGGTGRVSSATVEGEFAGTPVGACVSAAVRQAALPRFRAPTYRFAFPFQL